MKKHIITLYFGTLQIRLCHYTDLGSQAQIQNAEINRLCTCYSPSVLYRLMLFD